MKHPKVSSSRLQFPLVARLLCHRAMCLSRGRRRGIGYSLGIGANDGFSRLRPGSLLATLPGSCLFLGALLLVWTFEVDARLQRFFDEVRTLADRASLRLSLEVGREVTLGIVGATPEDVA